MADLCAPIPDVSVTSKSVQIEDLEFSSDHKISHSHEGVGSGKIFFLVYAALDILSIPSYSYPRTLLQYNLYI